MIKKSMSKEMKIFVDLECQSMTESENVGTNRSELEGEGKL
jgi:hypothetical protein